MTEGLREPGRAARPACGGDSETVARLWKEAFDQDTVRRPGRWRVLQHFQAISGLLVGAKQEGRAEVDQIRALSGDQLDKAMDRYLLENAPELFVEENQDA